MLHVLEILARRPRLTSLNRCQSLQTDSILGIGHRLGAVMTASENDDRNNRVAAVPAARCTKMGLIPLQRPPSDQSEDAKYETCFSCG